MELPRLILTIGLTLPGLGCVPRHPVRTDILLEIPCLQAPITLTDCVDGDPNRCKHSVITYKKGCEIVMAQKRK